MMPRKFRDDISNGSGVIVLTYIRTDRRTNGHYWEQYDPRLAGGQHETSTWRMFSD